MNTQGTIHKVQTNLKSQISITKRFIILNLVIVSCLFLVTWLLFLAAPAHNARAAEEASLSLSPSTGVYIAGEMFTVDVVLNTGGEKASAAEGVITFEPDDLTVTEISYEDSVFDSWVIAPDFSNTRGRVEFAGTSPKGFQDGNATVLTITFRALREGITRARFASGAVFSADGKGTNMISSLISGTYTLTREINEIIPQAEYIPPRNTPGAPVISSSTHPNQDGWYTENNVDLFWSVPPDTTAVRMFMDREPRTVPTNYYPYALIERSIKNLDDGIWYFHLQLRNAYGWGGVGHFKVQVDSSKPQYFRLKELSRTDPTDPVAKLVFDAFDPISGIKDYEVQITGRDTEYWPESGNQIHQTQPLKPGKYSIIAKAVDRAGNYIVDATDFEILPLQAPVFKDPPDVVRSGDPFVLRGISYPGSEVSIYIKPENDEVETYTVASTENGEFTYIASKTPNDGIYQVWAVTADTRGAQSGESKKITVAVRPPTLIYMSSLAADTVNTLIPLTALVFLLVVMVIYMRHKFIIFRAGLQKEVQEVETTLHRAFYTLRKETDRNLKMLENTKGKRNLTREEAAIMDGLRGNLSKVERMVEKEVEDVEYKLDMKKMKREDNTADGDLDIKKIKKEKGADKTSNSIEIEDDGEE